MKRAFQYRIYPNREQEAALFQQLNACRHLYNSALEQRREAYRRKKISLNYYDQAKELKDARESDEGLQKVSCSALQDVLRRLHKTYEAFFRRIKKGETPGYPRFKSAQRYASITWPSYGDGCKVTQGRLRLLNIGRIKVKWHRPLEGVIKTVTLSHKNGKWFVVFSVECEFTPLPPTGAEVGLDVGINSFLATSEGEFFENPRYLKNAAQRLQTQQRALSRKKRGSQNRKKAVTALANAHERVANSRKNFHHQTARNLVLRYDRLFVENLNIKGMLQNHRLAQSISDAGWRSFLSILSAKAESAGREVLQVNPRNTSQLCSGCGELVPKSLAVRLHCCPSCGLRIDRDLNAARNIKRLGLSLCGGEGMLSSVKQEAVCFS